MGGKGQLDQVSLEHQKLDSWLHIKFFTCSLKKLCGLQGQTDLGLNPGYTIKVTVDVIYVSFAFATCKMRATALIKWSWFDG
jgi:hypothetical protein